MKTKFNEFDPFLNECQTYVWEWYIPEQKVRFGIPSLNSLWLDDTDKNIKLATMLERVHPDDIQKVLVRHTSPLYKSDKMFEVDLRLNVAAVLMPDGQSSGKYEWYGFRGKTISRDHLGRPTYVRGIAINLDQRYRAQQKLIHQKERQLQEARKQADNCAGIISEVNSFLSALAENANTVFLSESRGNQEERLLRFTELKNQAERILELTDKFRSNISEGTVTSIHDVRSIAIWEHLAELQQIYSLKVGNQQKFYFSNLYDDLQIKVDVRLLDILLDNLLQIQLRNDRCIYSTLSYSADMSEGTLSITLTCILDKTPKSQTADNTVNTETGLSLSVCKMMAKRLYGEIAVSQREADKWCYILTLPIDVIKHKRFSQMQKDASQQSLYREDTLDEIIGEENDSQRLGPSLSALPHVLIGMSSDASLYRNQHLFVVSITDTTDAMLDAFEQSNPDIVFIDANLPGSVNAMETIERIHRQSPDTPIIVTDDYALRPLHKQIQRLGARYLLTNPLSLRKVNMMIKKYLK